MGVVSDRRRKQRLRRAGRLAALAGIASLLGISLLSSHALMWIGDVLGAGVQVFAGETGAQEQIVLPEMRFFALQLGVFDSEERAQSEAARLRRLGARCMIWQKNRLRLIADVAAERSSLDFAAACGQDAYVMEDALPAVRLNIGAGARDIDAVKAMLTLPDETIARMLGGAPAAGEIARVRPLAEAASGAHPEHALYTDLAKSLIAWCDMMQPLGSDAQGYAKAAMLALCRELRQALIEASTASAQRTPSTAADVMPPA